MKKQTGIESRSGEQGVVLLIVLILMVFVAALAMDIVKSARYDYSGASYLKNTYSGSVILESAAQAAHDLYVNKVASENGTAFLDLQNNFNSTMVSVSGSLDSGELSGKIEDEYSRLPINMRVGNATKLENVMTSLIVTLCSSLGYDNGDTESYARSYVNSLRCWTGNGTSCQDDDDYYNSADPGYVRADKPVMTIDELLLVKRPSNWLSDSEFDDLYYGTEDVPGLKDLVTPYSDGPMNINTLKKEIIMSFVPADRSMDDRLNFYEDVIAARYDNAGEEGWFTAVANVNKIYEKYIPEVGYSSDAARVTIWYNNGIYSSSLMEVFGSESGVGAIKYKKFGH